MGNECGQCCAADEEKTNEENFDKPKIQDFRGSVGQAHGKKQVRSKYDEYDKATANNYKKVSKLYALLFHLGYW
jgi:hypothetical protein